MEIIREDNFKILDLKDAKKFHILPIYMPEIDKASLDTVKTKIDWLVSKWDQITPIIPVVMGNVAKDVTKAQSDDEDEENLISLTSEMNLQIREAANLVKYLVEKFGKDNLVLLNGQKEISFNEKSKADFWEEVCDKAEISASQCYVKSTDKLNLVSYLRLRTATQDDKNQKVFTTIKFVTGSKSKAATLNGAVNAIKKVGPLTLDNVTDFTIASNGLNMADGRLDKDLQVVDSISASGRLPKFTTICVNAEKDLSVSTGLDIAGGKNADLIRNIEATKYKNDVMKNLIYEVLDKKKHEANNKLDKILQVMKTRKQDKQQSKETVEEEAK